MIVGFIQFFYFPFRFYKLSMNRSPIPLMRDFRNIKKNNTITFAMTSKELPTSTKDLKKARSSEQINLRGLIENKNEKIKNIDQKLDLHQGEIERNNIIIEQLTTTLEKLRDQVLAERSKTEVEEKKSKHLMEEMQRTNKLLRVKNIKIDELNKKLETLDKEIQVSRAGTQKIEEISKQNSQLRKQLSSLEEQSSNRKQLLVEKEKQNERLREKVNELGRTKAEYQKTKSLLVESEAEVTMLKSQIDSLRSEANNSEASLLGERRNYESRIKQCEESFKRVQNQLTETLRQQSQLKRKLQELEQKNIKMSTQLSSKESYQVVLKKELEEIRKKFNDVHESMKAREKEDRLKEEKDSAAKKIIEDLKKKLQIHQAEGEQHKQIREKIGALQKKSLSLSDIYKSIVPQIQCPYGHQLKDPVTIIPCGHNYCLGCKKGYTKECMMCQGKLKIEAVYRNELMDDIIGMVGGIKQILEIIR